MPLKQSINKCDISIYIGVTIIILHTAKMKYHNYIGVNVLILQNLNTTIYISVKKSLY